MAPLGSLNAWRAPDGQRVVAKTIHYDSESREEALEAWAKESTKTIERGPMLNDEGQVVGQRVVVEFTVKAQKAESMIMATDGSKLRELQSPSLEDALELEKMANQKSRPEETVPSVERHRMREVGVLIGDSGL